MTWCAHPKVPHLDGQQAQRERVLGHAPGLLGRREALQAARGARQRLQAAHTCTEQRAARRLPIAHDPRRFRLSMPSSTIFGNPSALALFKGCALNMPRHLLSWSCSGLTQSHTLRYLTGNTVGGCAL